MPTVSTAAAAAVRLLSFSEAQELLHGLETHTNLSRGMSNTALDRLARLMLSRCYRGLLPVDKIPAAALARCHDFCIIVNLGRAGSGDGHFVALVADGDRLRYLDSYALKVTVPELAAYLATCGRKVIPSRRPVQSRQSQTCGLYALLFAAYFDPGRRTPPDFSLRFHRRKLKSNDRLCVHYLRSLLYSNGGNDGERAQRKKKILLDFSPPGPFYFFFCNPSFLSFFPSFPLTLMCKLRWKSSNNKKKSKNEKSVIMYTAFFPPPPLTSACARTCRSSSRPAPRCA